MKLKQVFSVSALGAAILIAGFGGSAQAVTIMPAVEYTTSGTLSDNRAFTLGYSFSLSAPVTINALGYWDNGRHSNHQVGIWDAGGTLLTFTTVLGTDPTVGHFVWDAIPNFTLAAGNYVIGGEFLGDGTFNSFATGIVSIPEYTYGNDRQRAGAGLNFPTTTIGGYGANGILEVSFSVTAAPIPEPSSWALMMVGVGVVGATLRRRRAVAA